MLLKALAACGRDNDLTRVIEFVESKEKEFSFVDCRMPTLKTLVAWSKKRFGAIHPVIASWLAAHRQNLEWTTAEPPKPPADWARSTDVRCACEYCAQLKAFLSDPVLATTRIKASASFRSHLIQRIDQHRLDLAHKLVRDGNPMSLALTKTLGSHERAKKQYEADLKWLKVLEQLGE